MTEKFRAFSCAGTVLTSPDFTLTSTTRFKSFIASPNAPWLKRHQAAL